MLAVSVCAGCGSWRLFMCAALFIIHDLGVARFDQMFEIFLDRFHGVLLTDQVGSLLGDHHLGRVRVPAHARRYDGGVSHPQSLDTSNSATGSKYLMNCLFECN